jgi:hypothetical protein
MNVIGMRRVLVVSWTMVNLMVCAFLLLYIRMEMVGVLTTIVGGIVSICLAYLGVAGYVKGQEVKNNIVQKEG